MILGTSAGGKTIFSLKRRYVLSDLIAQCDKNALTTADMAAWDAARPVLRPRIRYTMAELLAQSDYSDIQPQAEREWVDAPPIGRELPHPSWMKF